jgi:DNA-binding NarL/FixJ family response regulator
MFEERLLYFLICSDFRALSKLSPIEGRDRSGTPRKFPQNSENFFQQPCARLRPRPFRSGSCDAGRAGLTRRELEVLAAMADGASNKAIARRLGISFHTAKFHVAAILAKLDADSRTEAVAKAAQLGLVML